MYNAHWIHSLPYSKFIELTLYYYGVCGEKSETNRYPWLAGQEPLGTWRMTLGYLDEDPRIPCHGFRREP